MPYTVKPVAHGSSGGWLDIGGGFRYVFKRLEHRRVFVKEPQQPIDHHRLRTTGLKPSLRRSWVHPAQPPPSQLREVEVG